MAKGKSSKNNNRSKTLKQVEEIEDTTSLKTKINIVLCVLIFLQIDSILIKIEPIIAKNNPRKIDKFNLFFFLSKICKAIVTKIARVFDINLVIKEEFFSLLTKKLEVKTEQTIPYKNK